MSSEWFEWFTTFRVLWTRFPIPRPTPRQKIHPTLFKTQHLSWWRVEVEHRLSASSGFALRQKRETSKILVQTGKNLLCVFLSAGVCWQDGTLHTAYTYLCFLWKVPLHQRDSYLLVLLLRRQKNLLLLHLSNNYPSHWLSTTNDLPFHHLRTKAIVHSVLRTFAENHKRKLSRLQQQQFRIFRNDEGCSNHDMSWSINYFSLNHGSLLWWRDWPSWGSEIFCAQKAKFMCSLNKSGKFQKPDKSCFDLDVQRGWVSVWSSDYAVFNALITTPSTCLYVLITSPHPCKVAWHHALKVSSRQFIVEFCVHKSFGSRIFLRNVTAEDVRHVNTSLTQTSRRLLWPNAFLSSPHRRSEAWVSEAS